MVGLESAVRLNLTTPELRFEVEDRVAIITITRSARGNAFTRAMARSFRDIWNEVRADSEIRVAILTGEGDRFFCTGADVKELGLDESGVGMTNAPLDQALTLTSQQNRVWKPIICAVNGLAAGGGLHFVVDSDIIVASSNATFFDSHVNVGQVGALENIGLAKRLPLGTALRMTLQGRSFRLTAERAYQLGLVDELVSAPEDALQKAIEIAREIAQHSPTALALSKEAIWKSLETGYTPALEYGWGLVRMHWGHPDCAEGPRAFSEKRSPNWNPDPSARLK